jgi:virulence factor Mce-like protein
MSDRVRHPEPRPARRRAPKPSLRRSDERMAGRHVRAGVALVVVAALITVISVVSIRGLPFTSPYRVQAVVPASAPIVRPGDEVRIAGQPVGQVRTVSPAASGRVISMEIDQGKVGRNARATVRLRGLAGAVYIDLDPGDQASPAPSGWTIPRSRTSTGTQLTDVVSAFDSHTRKGLRRTLTAYGGGIAGRGQELNQMLADLPPALRQGRPLLEALDPAPGSLADLVHGLDGTLVGLAGTEPGALEKVIAKGNTAVRAVAAEREPLAAAIRDLPATLEAARGTLPLASPLLADLRRTSTALAPVTARLGRALPSVNALLARTDDVGGVSELARGARPVLAAAGPVLRRAEPTAATLAPIATAVEPLAAYVARYPHDVFAGPHGFTTWGRFFYDAGQAPGHRAVRFTPVFTCAPGRDPYPAPGQASKDRMPCPQ